MQETISQPSFAPNFTQVRVLRLALTRSDLLVALLLIPVLLLAAYLRFTGLNWDGYTHFHPDERFLTNTAIKIGEGNLRFTPFEEDDVQRQACLERYPNSGGVGGYFDARCSDMNPHNVGEGLMVYGTMPLFIARWTADLLNQLQNTNYWTDYNAIHLVWRMISATCDMIAVLFIFLTGLKLHNKWVGLLAAALYAGAVFPIQIAHFATADGMTTMWCAITFYFAVRIQQDGIWLDYVFSGLAFGAALASRFNIAPLVIVILFAAAVRMLPVLDVRLPWSERIRAFNLHFGGLVVAGVLTLLVFRIFNPYAFVGPGFFGILPNQRWIANLLEAQRITSVTAEAPPQWQWVGRPPYFFPWWNMVMWGMGLGLGLTAWVAWLWSGWRFLRAKPDGLKNASAFLWILLYFGWVGGNYVMSMRYFLPLYPMLTVLAAWMLVEIVKRTQPQKDSVGIGFPPSAGAGSLGDPKQSRFFAPLQRGLALGLLGGVTAFTLLWGLMFTNIYRVQATYVQASHWIWENVSGDFSMRMDGTDPATVPLINLPLGNSGGIKNDALSKSTFINTGQRMSVDFTAPADGTVSSIYSPRIGMPTAGMNTPTTLRLVVSTVDAISGVETPLAETLFTQTFNFRGQVIGDPYTIPLSQPLALTFAQEYRFTVEVVSGGPIVTSGETFTWEGAWDEVVPVDMCIPPAGVTLASNPAPGYIASIRECDRIALWGTLLTGYELDIVREDDEPKRDEMLKILDHTDYIIIGTNRRYDSQSRIPLRWPMTLAYYEALFNGELGFERVALFHESFELGSLSISDQHLPFYDSPAWLNELEAEEAFHVYDHPAVMIYKKRADYSPQKTREILYSVSLTRPQSVGGNPYNNPTLAGPVVWSIQTADQAPTQLMMQPDMQAIQYNGGTWSQRFDRAALVNTQPVLGVIVWWLTVIAFGWAIFPLLFVILPGLADRGYAMAKFAGVLFVAWLGWYGASARFATWSPEGLRLLLLGLAAVSMLVALRNRAQLTAFIREKARLLLITEFITFLLFGVFIGVRLTNPDLWTTGFGGEKPMDYAYFNGVLRSTIFPAIDPWFAGGYINYYYFGFVIVAVPTLVTGIIPAVAYNLILPMLFAMTGIAAFSVAFTLVERWNSLTPSISQLNSRMNQVPLPEGEGFRVRAGGKQRLGNPYIAGIAALLMAVVLGNLDTPRTFFTGVARAGNYTEIGTMDEYLIDQYRAQNGREPDDAALSDIFARAQRPNLIDSVNYELASASNILTSIGRGIGNILTGEATLYINPDRWFWGPSRVITESVGGGAITEMPIFTYVYGDLHGHMIAMPLMLLIVGLVFNEIVLAGREQRGFIGRALGLSFIALSVGLTVATNTWEQPTFTLFAALGLGYAWWLNWRCINRAALTSMLVKLSTFFVLANFAAIPYRTWYAATYSAVRLWDGRQTPLWAYLTIHGLFLFIVVSLLVWETGRWLRTTQVRALRGKQRLLLITGGGVVFALVAALIAAVSDYQAALIVIPLVVWIAILFFRPNQSIPMQFVLVLMGLALAITLGVEIVTLEGDIGRQNTVFKFYIQVWLIFSVACGAAVAWLMQSSAQWRLPTRVMWYTPALILLFMAALFPIMAIRGKAVYRLADDDPLTTGVNEGIPLTLDGSLFMKYTTGVNAYNEGYGTPMNLDVDYDIIYWLLENVPGSPIIIEGQSEGSLYKWGGRIAIQTGLPSVVGWDFHQRQQRTFDPLPSVVNLRAANVNAFYTITDLDQAWRILRNYDVSYVIVGALELSRYAPSGGLAKFDAMVERGWLDVVYKVPNGGGAAIYKVNKDAAPGILIADAPTGDISVGGG